MEPPLGFERMLWDLWFDGREHTITESDPVLSFVGALRTQARKRKMFLWYEQDGATVRFQAYDNMLLRENERGVVGLQWYD